MTRIKGDGLAKEVIINLIVAEYILLRGAFIRVIRVNLS